MPTPLPFAITPEAADFIRSYLHPPRAGEELALFTVFREAEIVDGQERLRYEGEHFMVGAFEIGERTGAQHIELFGHRVSIIPSTLKALQGRTLAIRRIDCLGKTIDVLVAV